MSHETPQDSPRNVHAAKSPRRRFARLRSRDFGISALLFVSALAWLLAVEGRQGIGRDEAQYMRAGERYWGWFAQLADNVAQGQIKQSFTPSSIDRYWSDNAPDHPVIMKVLYGASWRMFSGPEHPAGQHLHPITPPARQGVIPIFERPSTAFRLPALVCGALLVVMVFVFARQFVGRIPAALAGVLALAQPHTFFHVQIACFDAPITLMAVAVGYAYWRALRSRKWGVAAGVLFGIALGVKHNAWLMPIFLLGHYLWMRRQDWLRLRLPPVPLAFVSMLVLGPAIFYAHWPWLWPQPAARAETYVRRHVQHEHYNFEYLGLNWNNPPQDMDRVLLRTTFPFVSTLFTLPVTTMALAGLGSVVLWRRRGSDAPALEEPDAPRLYETDAAALDETTAAETPSEDPAAAALAQSARSRAAAAEAAAANGRPASRARKLRGWLPDSLSRASWLRPGSDRDRAPWVFFGVQIFGPICVLAVPASPIFGGVKHFMPAFPYVAILSGIGASWLFETVNLWLKHRRTGAGTADGVPARRAGHSVGPTVALVGAFWLAAPAVVETQRSHPDGLSHYNLLAGGFAGGASLGMNRQFWGYSVLPMLPWMADNAPARGTTYWHDVLGDALNMYVRDGRLPAGMGNTGVGEQAVRASDLGIIVHERHMRLYEGVFWENHLNTQPAFVRTREGVPLVTAYKRPGAPFRKRP